MKATIRKRLIDNGKRESLRLDIYPPAPHPDTGRLTRWVNLGLYLHVKPKNSDERQENKETLSLATTIQAKIQLQLQAGQYGFLVKSTPVDFFEYYQRYVREKKCSPRTKLTYATTLFHLRAFTCNKKLFIADVNKRFLEEFRVYILGRMKNNSAVGVYHNLRTTLNQAYRDGLILKRVTELVPSIPQVQTKITYLTQEELNLLAKTPCKAPAVKRAALFSATTGIRFSDLENLAWKDIERDETGFYLHFRQKKTGGMNYLPISDNAMKILGEPGCGLVFPLIKSHIYKMAYFRDWINATGIKKHVTFHTFRHTFATLQLFCNTSINTISEMMGHTNIKTTMVYAHVVNRSKRIASDLININIDEKE
jgi:integrase